MRAERKKDRVKAMIGLALLILTLGVLITLVNADTSQAASRRTVENWIMSSNYGGLCGGWTTPCHYVARPIGLRKADSKTWRGRGYYQERVLTHFGKIRVCEFVVWARYKRDVGRSSLVCYYL